MKTMILILFAGCSSSGGDGGTTGGGGGSALIGTWDVSYTQFGTPTTFTVTVGAGSVSVDYQGTVVSLSPSSNGTTLLWDASSPERTTVTSTHSGGGNAGDLPIDPIGDWIFDDVGSGSLTASVTSTRLTTTCTGCGNAFLGYSFMGHLTGSKTSPASGPSIFGDLAGMWQISDEGGATFTAALIGSALQASFTESGSSSSFSISATLNGNMLSGSTTRPTIEFSARRR
jgi:hypothetical protein